MTIIHAFNMAIENMCIMDTMHVIVMDLIHGCIVGMIHVPLMEEKTRPIDQMMFG